MYVLLHIQVLRGVGAKISFRGRRAWEQDCIQKGLHIHFLGTICHVKHPWFYYPHQLLV